MASSKFINQQRVEARKSIAKCENLINKLPNDDRHVIIKVIAAEQAFLNHNFIGCEDVKKEIIKYRHLKVLSILLLGNAFFQE